MSDNENKLFKYSDYENETSRNIFFWVLDDNIKSLSKLKSVEAENLISFTKLFYDNSEIFQYESINELMLFVVSWIESAENDFINNNIIDTGVSFLKTFHDFPADHDLAKKCLFDFQKNFFNCYKSNKSIYNSFISASEKIDERVIQILLSTDSKKDLNTLFSIMGFIKDFESTINLLDACLKQNITSTIHTIIKKSIYPKREKEYSLYDKSVDPGKLVDYNELLSALLSNSLINIPIINTTTDNLELNNYIERLKSKSDYKILRIGQFIKIVWRAKTYMYKSTNGFLMIEFLINRSNNSFVSIQDLSKLALNEYVPIETNQKNPNLDSSLAILNRQYEFAKDTEDFAKANSILAVIKDSENQEKKASPTVEKARIRFKNAINLSIEYIHADCPELAEHLKVEISTGYNFKFKNSAKIPWC